MDIAKKAYFNVLENWFNMIPEITLIEMIQINSGINKIKAAAMEYLSRR
jgi:hypothetical protein